jgi:hypothetical protein
MTPPCEGFLNKNNIMENIITWDFMGWKEHNEPEVGLQLKWNKTLIEKFNEVSLKIHKSSFRGGADTITMSPGLEGLLHPDYYDNYTKTLIGGYKVVFDETVERYVIRLENLKVLEDLKLIPDASVEGEINLKPLNECTEEQIVNYIEGLVGFVIVENLFI